MEIIIKYFKNSNTGKLLQRMQFLNSQIKFPTYYYNIDGSLFAEIEFKNVDSILKGFVEISEKHFNQIATKHRKLNLNEKNTTN